MYVPVLSQENELSCTFVRCIDIVPFYDFLLDLIFFHLIVQFPDEPEVRIVSGDTLTISEGQTLTLKCSFDFGIGLWNVKWIHDNNTEIT